MLSFSFFFLRYLDAEIDVVEATGCIKDTRQSPITHASHEDAFTTGNPFLGIKILGFSIRTGSGALKGLTNARPI